ncbi:Hypothetical Protein FCC1311_055222 [Hondaea fermentalgiana]|uniref:Uncharacterized protein n=1 Tax=Hondaea fermentalgiana TaxID=2315210 RepID=A0A2R5GEC6_9STRA|nr:Hypothetical Protein FCC1311_055222 [Hondaea fermentalgiana]|eukprot:GBG29300.1 Hypothetical Protein FCC1311_055222 [Hondaea fermentalgiana]
MVMMGKGLALVVLAVAAVVGGARAEEEQNTRGLLQGQSEALVAQALEAAREDRRSLLVRTHEDDEEDFESRLLGKKKKKGLGLKKVGKAISGVGKDISKAAKSAKSALSKAFKGKWIKRDKSFWDKIENGGQDAWKGLVQGTGTIDNYMNNHFVDDLEWMGKQIAEAYDVFCGIDVAVVAVIYACSIALNAALCAATSGCGPWCGPDKKLIHKILEMVGVSVAYNLIKCGAYHSLKEIDGLCKGRAMGVADQLALSYLGDPFTPTCNTAVSCSCGDCWWECSYEVHAVCQGNTWKQGVKAIADALASL